MISGIRHIIFDLGAVLIDLDVARTEQAFETLSGNRYAAIKAELHAAQLFDNFEKGTVSEEEFISKLGSYVPDADPADIVAAWNAMLLEFPLQRLQLLQQLRLRYDLVLLSNTNSIHESAFNDRLAEAIGFQNIGLLFDKVYLSHKVGLRKPDPAIFERVLADNGFEPAHTLFIDDTREHIDAARQLGIQCIWMEPGMTIETDIFKRK